MALINFFTGEKRLVGKVVGANPVGRHHQVITSVTFWHPEKKTVCTIEVGADWYCDAVDISGESLREYTEYMLSRRIIRIDIEENKHCTVRFGDTVRVVRGRKVPLMKHGTLQWAKRFQYGINCGFRDDSGKMWFTAATNLQMWKDKRWIRPVYIVFPDGNADVFC